MTTSQLSVIVFQEDDLFIAQCIEHDIVAQDRDLDSALARLDLTIEAECEMRGERGLGDIPRAPQYYADLWENRTINLTRTKTLVESVDMAIGFTKKAA